METPEPLAQLAVVGGNLNVKNSTCGVVITGGQVHLSEGSRVLLTNTQAAAFGAAFGALFALMSWLVRRRSGWRNARSPGSRMLKNSFLPRLLKKAQMQGGLRCEVRGVLGPYAAAPRERTNAADGPFSAADLKQNGIGRRANPVSRHMVGAAGIEPATSAV